MLKSLIDFFAIFVIIGQGVILKIEYDVFISN